MMNELDFTFQGNGRRVLDVQWTSDSTDRNEMENERLCVKQWKN